MTKQSAVSSRWAKIEDITESFMSSFAALALFASFISTIINLLIDTKLNLYIQYIPSNIFLMITFSISILRGMMFQIVNRDEINLTCKRFIEYKINVLIIIFALFGIAGRIFSIFKYYYFNADAQATVFYEDIYSNLVIKCVFTMIFLWIGTSGPQVLPKKDTAE